MSINPQPKGYGESSYDSRQRVNSELYDYGRSFEHNPAQRNESAWRETPSPVYGVPNQPQAGNPSQLMTPGWNQQQLSPQITPPPYPGRPAQPAEDYSAPPQAGNSAPSQSQGTGFNRSEPAPIYSPGVRVPAAYGSGNRTQDSYEQSGNGPRITPARR